MTCTFGQQESNESNRPLVVDTVVIRLAQALEMPTLKLYVDAYRLLRSAHRLSDAARHAITGATQDSKNGLWSFDCSPEVASELLAWFDDCERHAALLSRESWKVNVCRRAKDRIRKAK